jgi:hypothetical protein
VDALSDGQDRKETVMQAQGMKRFTFNQVSGTTLGIAVLVGALIVVGVLRETDSLPTVGGTTSETIAPAAIYVPPADRDLREGFNPGQLGASSAVTAFHSPNMGEGLLNLQLEQTVKPVYPGRDHGLFLDEGIAPSVMMVNPALYVYPSPGEAFTAGEGIAPALRIETVLRAHPSPGQGEGIIGGHNVFQGNDTPIAAPAETVGIDRLLFLESNVYLPTGGAITPDQPWHRPQLEFTAE